jgi:nucleotide-binding universal stress UspA family protein
MKNILAAVDGSAESRRAARLARDLAVRSGSELTLVCVIPPAILPSSPDPDVILPWNLVAFQKAEQRAAQETLKALSKEVESPGLTVNCRVLRGSPAEAISKLASSLKADLVVVGSRGKGKVARVLLGSVSDRLAHISKQPVLISR